MKRWNLIANKAEENDAKRLLGSYAVATERALTREVICLASSPE